MRKTIIILLPLLTVLQLLFSCTDGERMRLRMASLLDRADSLNRNYVPMTGGLDSLLREAVDYYDRHGTPNEQMRAYYLLGCAHRDMEEAPQALQSYQDAIDRADTLAPDCDYRLLCRVHSQIADILSNQNMLDEAIKEDRLSAQYAWTAGDTLPAILSMGQLASDYFGIGKEDSILKISEMVCRLSESYGYAKIGNTELAPAIYIYLTRGNYSKAKEYLDRYEFHSEWADTSLYFFPQYKMLYYYKGLYYLGIGKPDSANFYFREQVANGNDINNTALGNRGLYMLYKKEQSLDSIVKYADLSYDLKDSDMNASVHASLQNIQALYNYSRYQRTAEKQTLRAERLQAQLILAFSFLLFIVIISSVTVWMIRLNTKRRMQKMAYEYSLDILTYQDLKTEIEQLSSQRIEDKSRITSLEEKLSLLLNSIAEKQGHGNLNMEDMLLESHIVKRFHHCAARAITVSENDWYDLRAVANHFMPNFIHTLQSFEYHLNLKETEVCILIKLRFIPSELCTLLRMKPNAVSNMRSRLHKKLFHTEGSATEFDDAIRQIRC